MFAIHMKYVEYVQAVTKTKVCTHFIGHWNIFITSNDLWRKTRIFRNKAHYSILKYTFKNLINFSRSPQIQRIPSDERYEHSYETIASAVKLLAASKRSDRLTAQPIWHLFDRTLNINFIGKGLIRSNRGISHFLYFINKFRKHHRMIIPMNTYCYNSSSNFIQCECSNIYRQWIRHKNTSI